MDKNDWVPVCLFFGGSTALRRISTQVATYHIKARVKAQSNKVSGTYLHT